MLSTISWFSSFITKFLTFSIVRGSLIEKFDHRLVITYDTFWLHFKTWRLLWAGNAIWYIQVVSFAISQILRWNLIETHSFICWNWTIELIKVHTTYWCMPDLKVIPRKASSLFELSNLLQLANRNLSLLLVRILEIETFHHRLSILFYYVFIKQIDYLECTWIFFPLPLVSAHSDLISSGTHSLHVGRDVYSWGSLIEAVLSYYTRWTLERVSLRLETLWCLNLSKRRLAHNKIIWNSKLNKL